MESRGQGGILVVGLAGKHFNFSAVLEERVSESGEQEEQFCNLVMTELLYILYSRGSGLKVVTRLRVTER